MLRILGVILGIALIVVGVPLTPTPIPLGLTMVVLGVLLLAGSSKRAAQWVRGRRARHARLDDAFCKAGKRLPPGLSGPFDRTDPNRAQPPETGPEA